MSFHSPRFFANSLRWGLRLNPISPVGNDYIGISLTLLTNAEVFIKYELAVLNDDDQKFALTSENQVYFHQKSSRICCKFIKHDELMNKKNRLLVNGSLTILCEIRVDFSMYTDLKNADAELQTTKRMRMLEEFFDFEQFLLSQKFCDVTFIVGDKKLCAHKVVLASKSQTFARLFEANQKQVIEITDIDYNVFIELLRFVYTRTMRDIKEMAKRLFVAADKYGLNDLKNLCADALVKEISKSNAIEYLSLADRYGLQSLRSKALDYIATNVDGLKNVAK